MLLETLIICTLIAAIYVPLVLRLTATPSREEAALAYLSWRRR